jgi:hypothetical protein
MVKNILSSLVAINAFKTRLCTNTTSNITFHTNLARIQTESPASNTESANRGRSRTTFHTLIRRGRRITVNGLNFGLIFIIAYRFSFYL